MIMGIGIDVVNVKRLQRWEHQPGLWKRFFHPRELAACLGKGEGGVLSLAARFAAKEALGKALGTGLAGFSLRDICVMNDAHGRPGMELTGRAATVLAERGGGSVFVSLTHERDYALAMVVIEAEA